MSMAASRLVFLSCTIFIQLFVLTTAQPYNVCYTTGNFTDDSIYQSNLNLVLSSITTDIEINSGFYNFSFGQYPDNVHAIGLCRGDVKTEICRSCIRNSTQRIRILCPTQKEAVLWYDNCMLRYSDRSIFGRMEISPYLWMYYGNNVSNPSKFNQAVSSLFGNLTDKAASDDSHLKFATGNIITDSSETLFALVQCTPDLSVEDCNECLINTTKVLPQCCDGRQGGRVIGPSCNVWYDKDQFYDIIVDDDMSPSTNTSTTKGKKSHASKTIIIVIPVTIFVVLVTVMIFIYLRVQKPKAEITTIDYKSEIMESLQYDFSFIRAATDNFSEANKLGQGGFGVVYKGTFPNRQKVAVKRLSKESSQGEVQFKNEVMLLAKLQHRNLVRLIGFCYERTERLLIYEFVPNSSLNNFLSDHKKHAQLDWESRYNVIYGIVRGLIYLHEESQHRIIHRDLKAENILLDATMNAKISDFGTARLFTIDQTQDDTSRVIGTYGYMAPEYVANGHFSAKSDVFSFGVIVLEVLSGQRNKCFRVGEDTMDLKTYAWQSWNEGTALNLIDPTLGGGPTSEIMRCLHIGLLCVQEDDISRPTMPSVGVMLSSSSTSLPQPSKPAFFMQSIVEHDQSNNKFGHLSRNEPSITEQYPR